MKSSICYNFATTEDASQRDETRIGYIFGSVVCIVVELELFILVNLCAERVGIPAAILNDLTFAGFATVATLFTSIFISIHLPICQSG